MILEFLKRSRATEPFREALARFLADGRANERIAFDSRCPPVKVERALTKALTEYPGLSVESIEIRAVSGCEYFRGEMEIHADDGSRTVAFHWDCKWRAEQEGWRDWFGLPDQARAAREFEWDCFRHWEELPAGALAPRAADPVAV